MKQIVLTLFLSLFFFSAAYAQDMESATNLYNTGVLALNEGKTADALKSFESALEQTLVIGPEADELAKNCKNTIPALYLAIGKGQAAEKDMDNAIATLKKAIEKGDEFGQTDVVAEASNLIPQLFMAEGNALLNAGNFPGAVAEYKKVIENDPQNGVAYLRLGQASLRANDEATALDAFAKAKEFGQAAGADKEISKLYLKKAAASLKAKKTDEALSFAQKSNEALESPQALNIIGKVTFTQKKYSEAITAFEAYLAASPKAKDANQAMYQLAVSYESTGDKAKACGYYKQILADPNFAEYAKSKVEALKCN